MEPFFMNRNNGDLDWHVLDFSDKKNPTVLHYQWIKYYKTGMNTLLYQQKLILGALHYQQTKYNHKTDILST